jgi:sarcosine oxidase, subunit alpha
MPDDFRIHFHPILPIPARTAIDFFWQGQKLTAYEGETIASALFAHGIRVFGHHPKDQAHQGIFCANGQCAQCMVLANRQPVKSCMEVVRPGLCVEPLEGLPDLPKVASVPILAPIQEIEVPVLIIGGGPAGLSAGIELGKRGVKTLIVDDKHRLGGKLVLQTHRFFGSTNMVYAGTRGIDIATKLENEVRQYPSLEIWLRSSALAVFSDQKVGILKDGNEYRLVKPQTLLVASGARENFLAFKGNTLPGVYGAGAFQTLVNRDLIRPAEKLFIVGGGNVGLIAGYHALQAGIGVVGLVEALPECGGYKVHKDKLVRMGVPIYVAHTILSANGKDQVESVTIARVDEHFKAIPGTEQSFACDAVLIAVGLNPVNEFYKKAVEFNLEAFSAGDAEEIAEASAAMFSGRIKGLEICKSIGVDVGEIPSSWYRMGEILKSRPGEKLTEIVPQENIGVFPNIHCTQEIPCDPCASLCTYGLIFIDKSDIRHVPTFIGAQDSCKVCRRCVAGCPGLAITLVDHRKNLEEPIVTIPYEFNRETIRVGDRVVTMDTEGNELGMLEVAAVSRVAAFDRTALIQVQAPRDYARRIAGIRVQEQQITHPMNHYVEHVSDDTIVCRCERVTAGEIRELVRQGYRDMNELKVVTRAGMGACGAKTCNQLIHRIFREEGVPSKEIADHTRRPLFVEVPLGMFAGESSETEGNQ